MMGGAHGMEVAHHAHSEKRPSPSRFWTGASPVVAVILTMIAGGLMSRDSRQEPDSRAIRTIFWDPIHPGRVCRLLSEPALGESRASDPDRHRALARLPRRDLEYRGRGPVYHRRDLRRGRRRALPSIRLNRGSSCPDGGCRCLRRLALGDDPSDPSGGSVPTDPVSLLLVYVAQALLSPMAPPCTIPKAAGSGLAQSQPVSVRRQSRPDRGDRTALGRRHRLHRGDRRLYPAAAAHARLPDPIDRPGAARFAGVKPGPVGHSSLHGDFRRAGPLAGLFEVKRWPAGQISIDFASGYGFTAIIVAFLGRFQPDRDPVCGLLMAPTYVGGDLASSTLNLPSAAIQAFQGMLLFFLLAVDMLSNHRFAGPERSRLMLGGSIWRC